MAIAIFFTGHWFSSLFSQTFFLHRYGAHQMFKMNKFWEVVMLSCIASTMPTATPKKIPIHLHSTNLFLA